MLKITIVCLLIHSISGEETIISRNEYGVLFSNKGMINPISDKIRVNIKVPSLDVFPIQNDIEFHKYCQERSQDELNLYAEICSSFETFLNTTEQINEKILQKLLIIYNAHNDLKIQETTGVSITTSKKSKRCCCGHFLIL